MESGPRPEAAISKKQFARIHEKIQNKYEEMQRRLEKSKSIDMLQNVGTDIDYKNDKKSSVCDLDTADDVFTMMSYKTNANNKHVKTVNNAQFNAVFEDVKVKEAVITKSVSILSLNEKFDSDGEDNFENNIFFKNSFKTSIESLVEAAKESDDSNELQTPTSKSIRSRIGSHITAVKNRRQEKKEKRVKEKKDARDKVEKFILSNSTKLDLTKFEKKIKSATVTVALIDVSGFEENPEEKPRSLVCRFRLGNEKRKSKLVKSNQNVVKFQEILSFEQYDDDNLLEVVLWDRDNPIGRTMVDLTLFEKEKTQKLKNTLTKNIKMFMLVTISGSCLANTLYDIDETKCKELISSLKRKYAWYKLCGEFSKVGHLWIVVYGAKGLSSHDCYCVLNLNNESVRTITDYKTNAPSWMKIFSFVITDITASLEVIVNDEKRSEEVGKVTIPLLEVDSGKKKWYALKDITQTQAAKGQDARILLEINISWNLVKAAVKVVNLKEVNYLQADEKLDRHLFARNLSRAKSVISWILNFLKIFKTCFQWESPKVNLIALVVWTLFWSFGKVWMTPLLLLIPFVVYNQEKISYIRKWNKNSEELENESKLDKDEKSLSLRQKINSWQEMIQQVQNSIGKFASLGESVKNLYNFSVPFVSYLAIFLVVLIAFVMYLIPFNYICIGWGVHKFTQKIFRPNRIPHNEIMDLITRVPDDEALEKRKVIPVENVSDDDEC